MPEPHEPPDPLAEHTRLRPPGRDAPPPPPPPPPHAPPAPQVSPPSPPPAPWYGGPGWATLPLEGPPPPPPPPPRRNGLLVGLVIATVIGLVCVVVLGVLVWADRRDDDGVDRATDEGGRSSAAELDGAARGGAATPAPSPSSPAAPTPPTEPDTSPAPPLDVEPPGTDPTGRFSYTEYGDDWDFRYGDVELQARFRQGWDYDDCGPVEVSGALTELGCRRASEWTYRALGGDLALTHLVLTMGSARQAKQAVEQELIDADSWQVDDASVLAGRDGAWRANSQGEFIVLTVETHEPGVPAARSQEFLQYANADILGALAFRF